MRPVRQKAEELLLQLELFRMPNETVPRLPPEGGEGRGQPQEHSEGATSNEGAAAGCAVSADPNSPARPPLAPPELHTKQIIT